MDMPLASDLEMFCGQMEALSGQARFAVVAHARTFRRARTDRGALAHTCFELTGRN